MTIRDMDVYIRSLWDWEILNGCFGATRISVSDMDGFVERNGHTLVIEAKNIGANIPTGQRIAFENWVATGKFCVIIVWGNTNEPVETMMYTPFGIKRREKTDLDGFRDQIRRWFEWADSQPKNK